MLKWLNNKQILHRDLSKFGSDDYKAIPNEMKGVFNRIVNEDLTKYTKQIQNETLIIWGKKDDATPYYMAKKLNKNIKNSAIITFDDAGHFSYLKYHSQFLLIIKSFLS